MAPGVTAWPPHADVGEGGQGLAVDAAAEGRVREDDLVRLLDHQPVAVLVVRQPGDVVVVLVPVLPGVEIVLVEDRQGRRPVGRERDGDRQDGGDAEDGRGRDGQAPPSIPPRSGPRRVEARVRHRRPRPDRVDREPGDGLVEGSLHGLELPTELGHVVLAIGRGLGQPLLEHEAQLLGHAADRRSGGTSLVIRLTSATRL